MSENISAHKQRVIYYCNNAICLETATEYLLIHGQLFLLDHFISVNIIYESDIIDPDVINQSIVILAVTYGKDE